MSKQALGSIPTFDTVERQTEELDIFKEVKKNDQEAPKEDIRAKLLREMKAEKESFKKEREARKEQDLTLEEIQKETIVLSKPVEVKPKAVRQTKAEEKPSTQRDVRKGYIRQTFVISNENLELIRALSSYQNIKQVDLLEALLERGLADISEEVKDKALKQFRKDATGITNNNNLNNLFK